MAQGQAMSLLVRAAFLSHKEKYIDAAVKATKLFSLNSTEGQLSYLFFSAIGHFLKYGVT